MVSAVCTVNGLSTSSGQNVSAGSTVVIALANTAGVRNWTVHCLSTDDQNNPTTIDTQLASNNNPYLYTTSYTQPSTTGGCAIQITVTATDSVGNFDKQTFGVWTLSGLIGRQFFPFEKYESDPIFGIVKDLNVLIRSGGSVPNATNTVSGKIILTQDLGGTYSLPKVVGLQTNPVDNTVLGATQDGYILTWNNSFGKWIAESASVYEKVTMTGDVSGFSNANTVNKVDGVSYPASPSTNTVPVVTGANTVTYQQIADAQVSATAAIAGTKISPNFGSQNIVTTGASNNLGATTISTLTATTGNITTVGATTVNTPTLATTSGGLSIAPNSGFTTFTGAVNKQVRTITSTSTVDSGTHPDNVLICNFTANSNITLPAPTASRELIIVDGNGNFGTYTINLMQHGSEKINSIAATRQLFAAYGRYTVYSDGTDWYMMCGNGIGTKTFTSSTTFTIPSGVNQILAVGCGGGGGGGAGCYGDNSSGNSTHAQGGGGGGGAALVQSWIPVTPNTTYTITIGAGGTASVANTSVATGTAAGGGGDSSISLSGTNLILFPGASGGGGIIASGSSSYINLYSGGSSFKSSSGNNIYCAGEDSPAPIDNTSPIWAGYAGCGGKSGYAGFNQVSLAGIGGGAAGSNGTNSGAHFGGIGGGGGGAGAFGAGATGGVGGTGLGISGNPVGGNGTNASANTGAGAGAGGGGGASAINATTGGAGGVGGSGQIILYWTAG